jgi:hypothetical protein
VPPAQAPYAKGRIGHELKRSTLPCPFSMQKVYV